MTLVNFKNPNAHLKVTAIMYLTLLNSMNKTSYKMDSELSYGKYQLVELLLVLI